MVPRQSRDGVQLLVELQNRAFKIHLEDDKFVPTLDRLA